VGWQNTSTEAQREYKKEKEGVEKLLEVIAGNMA
jgi:hypothetical protein